MHFYCDVLVRAPSLSGLHKQKALPCNQHPPKAQTCLIWNLDRSSLSLPARRKNNNSSICCSWGRPRSPLIVICYLRCDMRDAHTALQSLGGRSPEKQDASWCNIWLFGLERWVERRKKGSKRNEDVRFILFYIMLLEAIFKITWGCRSNIDPTCNVMSFFRKICCDLCLELVQDSHQKWLC